MMFSKSLASILLNTLLFFFTGCSSSTTNNNIEETDISKKLSLNDSIPIPSKIENILSDNSKVFYIDNSSLLTDTQIKDQKKIKLNGDVFFNIEGGNLPLYIFTSLMEIQVLTPSAFRVTAYDEDQGQSIETLKGTIKVSKAYPSPFPDPDTLHENNLYMINKSIDLSEKENLDDNKLSVWWNKLKIKSLQ